MLRTIGSIAAAGILAACTAISETAEATFVITVPVAPDAADRPTIQVTGSTDGLCGGEGGCIYAGSLSGPHAEGFGYLVGWEFVVDADGGLTIPNDVEMPAAAPGDHLIQLYAQQASDAVVNDERQLEAVVAQCNARFAVDEAEAEVVIEVAFIFEEPGEGRCSVARHGEVMEPAFTFAPRPTH